MAFTSNEMSVNSDRIKAAPENSRTADICFAKIKKAANSCRQQAIFSLLFTHFYNEILITNRTFCFHTIPVCLDFKLFFAMGAIASRFLKVS